MDRPLGLSCKEEKSVLNESSFPVTQLGSIESIQGWASKGFLKTMISDATYGIVYGDTSTFPFLRADPIDRADMEAYEVVAGLERYASVFTPTGAANFAKKVVPEGVQYAKSTKVVREFSDSVDEIVLNNLPPYRTKVETEIAAIQNLGSGQRNRFEIDPALPGERSLSQADYKAMMALEGQSGHLLQILGNTINNQDYVYRYTTLDTVKKYYMPSVSNPNGGILRQSFMTTDYLGLDQRSVMSQAQVLEAWGAPPEVLLKIPVQNLKAYSVPRPFGNSYFKGYEPITSSYPAAGVGGVNQFMGIVDGWEDSWLIFLDK